MRQDFFKLVTDNRFRSYNFSVSTNNALFVNTWNGECKATLRSYPMVAGISPTFQVEILAAPPKLFGSFGSFGSLVDPNCI